MLVGPKPGSEAAYSHRFHVGNHADVWKHTALLALLDALPPGAAYVDTHAGEGGYRLQSTGEWTAGVGRLWARWPDGATGNPAVDRYLAALAAVGAGPARSYPGSPLLALLADTTAERRVLYERDPDACRALRGHIGLRAAVIEGDGYAATPPPGPGLLLMDPPFAAREDWTRAPEAFARMLAGAPGWMGALWYPIKAWSRPNLLLTRLREHGTPYVAIDLVVTPLELKRPQLAGSGLALVNAPPEVVDALLGAAAALGRAMSTHEGRWSLRVTGEGA